MEIMLSLVGIIGSHLDLTSGAAKTSSRTGQYLQVWVWRRHSQSSLVRSGGLGRAVVPEREIRCAGNDLGHASFRVPASKSLSARVVSFVA